MAKLIHPDSLQFETPVDSYWAASADPLALDLQPLRNAVSVDVAIIGGGFTGLSAAIELAQHGEQVCLLEAGPIGWGASGRNGGFACIGSHKLPYTTMIKRYGLEATRSFYAAMRESVDLVADNASRFEIDIWKHGEGEVTLAHAPSRFEDLKQDQAFYKTVFGEDNELLDPETLRHNGLYGPHFHGGLRGSVGFGIHPLNYVRGLARAAHGAGATLCPMSKVVKWEQRDGKHILYTDHAAVTARRVVVASNGYTPEDVSPLHAGRVLPALSNIIVTRPLTDNEMQDQGWTASTMAYDSRNLLHYFRLLSNKRFLFGGRGGTHSSQAAAVPYQNQLTKNFRKLFPAWAQVEITHFWRGHVCLSYDRVPYVGALDAAKTVWTALAYHGNGVAMGSWCGRSLARLMLGKAKAQDMPAVVTRRLAMFPLPAFRPLYLKGAYVWYGWKDGA